MSTHRTRQVEVKAFRWEKQNQDHPEWLTATLFYPASESVRLSVKNADGSSFDAMLGNYLVRFPDGHIEERTPEEFSREFEPLIADDRPVDCIPTDGTRREEPR